MYGFRAETSSEMYERLTAERDAITIEIDEIELERDIAYALLTEREAALANAAVAQFGKDAPIAIQGHKFLKAFESTLDLPLTPSAMAM